MQSASSSSMSSPPPASSSSAASPLSRICESEISQDEAQGRERVDAFLSRRPHLDDFVSPKQSEAHSDEDVTTASEGTPLRVRSQSAPYKSSTRAPAPYVRNIGSGPTWQAAAGIPTRPEPVPTTRPPQPRISPRTFLGDASNVPAGFAAMDAIDNYHVYDPCTELSRAQVIQMSNPPASPPQRVNEFLTSVPASSRLKFEEDIGFLEPGTELLPPLASEPEAVAKPWYRGHKEGLFGMISDEWTRLCVHPTRDSDSD